MMIWGKNETKKRKERNRGGVLAPTAGQQTKKKNARLEKSLFVFFRMFFDVF